MIKPKRHVDEEKVELLKFRNEFNYSQFENSSDPSFKLIRKSIELSNTGTNLELLPYCLEGVLEFNEFILFRAAVALSTHYGKEFTPPSEQFLKVLKDGNGWGLLCAKYWVEGVSGWPTNDYILEAVDFAEKNELALRPSFEVLNKITVDAQNGNLLRVFAEYSWRKVGSKSLEDLVQFGKL